MINISNHIRNISMCSTYSRRPMRHMKTHTRANTNAHTSAELTPIYLLSHRQTATSVTQNFIFCSETQKKERLYDLLR